MLDAGRATCEGSTSLLGALGASPHICASGTVPVIIIWHNPFTKGIATLLSGQQRRIDPPAPELLSSPELEPALPVKHGNEQAREQRI